MVLKGDFVFAARQAVKVFARQIKAK